jgi:hypothetical protein
MNPSKWDLLFESDAETWQLFGTCHGTLAGWRPGRSCRLYGLLKGGEKRVTRHAPHDRIRYEELATQRIRLNLDVLHSIVLPS